MLPGSFFSDPELSWKFEVGPGGIGFLDSNDLGRDYENDLFMGGSRDFPEGGHIFRFNLTRDRRDVDVDDPRLQDEVADNVHKWELTKSESPSSAATSAPAPTSRPARTAICTSFR